MEEPRKAGVVEMKIGVVRGTFQILHAGHVELLYRARKLVDHLVVFIDGDERVKELKGECFVSSIDRSSIIRGIRFVDSVVVFNDENDFRNEIDKLNEDHQLKWATKLYFKGGDYRPNELPEFQWLNEKGWIVCCLGHSGHSTSDLVKRIRESKNA